MKRVKMFSIALAFAIVVVLIHSGCASPTKDEVKTPANVEQAEKDLIEAQKAYTLEVDLFKKDMEVKIAANEKTIAEMKAKRKNDGSANQESYNERIAELEQKNADLKKRISEFKEDNQQKWQSFKTEFSHDMDDLGTALKNITVDNVK
jgi:hypothetical protein